MLRAINFLENPNAGKIILDGNVLLDCSLKQKVNEQDLREKRLNFGLVFQSFNLFPQYNVLKNVTIAPKLLIKTKIKGLKKKLKSKGLTGIKLKGEYLARKMALESDISKIEDKALAIIEKMGLTEKINSYPCQLSGGQQQRVAIARALALEPKILCFDEPTSALDPELTGEVLKAIRSLKDDGRTMIIVTHEMGFAKNVSDRVVFMANGVIEEEGNPIDIFENPQSELLKAFLSNVDNKEGI